MNDESTLLNVCMLPADKVALQCITISKGFSEDSVRFTLGNGLFPHATLYMARFNNADIEKIAEAFKSIVQTIKPVALQHSGYYLTEGDYLEVSYQRSPELLALHDQIIQGLKNYRAYIDNPPRESYYGPYNQKQQENVRETGYDLAYDLYRPHITLTRYKEGALPVEFPAFEKASLSFTLPKIALYKADENGAVFEEIVTAELS
jgi:2'-5' RNA ligase